MSMYPTVIKKHKAYEQQKCYTSPLAKPLNTAGDTDPFTVKSQRKHLGNIIK